MSINYIKDFVSKLPIGPEDFQIALATYAHQAQFVIQFDRYHNRKKILSAIEDTKSHSYPGGPTYTYTALDWGLQVNSVMGD